MNTERYFDCQYRVKGGGSFKVVRRPAQSLCLLLTAQEIEDNKNITRDSIDFPLETSQSRKSKQKPRLKVQVTNMVPAIDDVLQTTYL